MDGIFKDYEYLIWCHPRKVNVIADTLSRTTSVSCFMIGEENV